MSGLVQIGNFTDNGYKSVVTFGGWRVAYLNNTTSVPSEISYFERHVESDELFVLVEGTCKLLVSPTGFDDLEVMDMEPLVMYNVRQTAYHAVQMQPGCRILIVENHDVSKENTLFHYLNDEEKKRLADALMC
jgi:hypothetical protein